MPIDMELVQMNEEQFITAFEEKKAWGIGLYQRWSVLLVSQFVSQHPLRKKVFF
jgi:hypothetical protein